MVLIAYAGLALPSYAVLAKTGGALAAGAVVMLAGLIAMAAYYWMLPQNQSPASRMVSAFCFYTGLVTVSLMTLHFIAILGVHPPGMPVLSDRVLQILILIGVVVTLPGLCCLLGSHFLSNGYAWAPRWCLWSTLVLLVINVLFAFRQAGAIALAGLAILNLCGLIYRRRVLSD